MLNSLFADLSFLPGQDLYWILGAGAVATALVYLLATQLFSRHGPTETTSVVTTPMVDPFDNGASSERRQAFRRKGHSVSVQISDANQKTVTWEGCVIDRSTSGLGLWSERQAKEGQSLRVRPENAPAMTPWVEVEVRSCKPHEGGWQLGCAFLQTPSYAVLLLFG